MASVPTLIPRLFRNLGIAKSNGASILKTEVGHIIDFRSMRSLDNNLFLKENIDYVSFKINADYFTVNSLTSSYATFSNITSSIGKFTFLTGSNISGSQATFTRLTGSDTLTTFFTSSYAKITQITGSHQKMIDGTNAFIAGHGITVQNHFNGSVGISSSLSFTSVKTTTYTAVVGDVVLADITGGSFTVNLPDATIASNKNGEIIIKLNGAASANTLTVDGNSSQTIDGSITRTLTTDYASMWIKCDGANWWRLA